MAKLTDEQVEHAAKAAFGLFNSSSNWKGGTIPSEYMRGQYRNAMRAAAPFLQIPWDGPTLEEVMTAVTCFEYEIEKSSDIPFKKTAVAMAIGFFVQKRNESLLPKPADFRRQIIATELGALGIDVMLGFKAADRILTALDEVKP